jgi:diguanylate cyclase (GGDEF)-like protein
MSGGTAAPRPGRDHRHALERVALWTRLSVIIMVGGVLIAAPHDVHWTTSWQPAFWQVSTVIGVQLAAAMILAVLRLRHLIDGRHRWVSPALTACDVLAVASPMLVVDSVAGVPVWPSAVLALLSAATRHRLTGVLIAWAVVAAALVTGIVLGPGGPEAPYGPGIVLAVVVLLVAATSAGVQASSLDRYVSDLHSARLAMAHQARTDPLTGLANRAGLEEFEIAQQASPDTAHSLVLLDLDGFKQVNDAHGHHAGDLLLQTVAARLHAHLGMDDLLVRLGGDEFVVVLRGASTADVDTAVATWTRAITEPVDAGGAVVSVGVSAGVAHHRHGEPVDFDDLLRTADQRMYRHKQEKATLRDHRSNVR